MDNLKTKMLFFIPSSIILYQLLNKQNEVKKQQKFIEKYMTYSKMKKIEYFQNEILQNRKRLLKIMKDEIINREIKIIINQLVINIKIEEKIEEEYIVIDLFSEDSYEKI